MEKINNIFLNYKTYDAFLQDLFDEKISPSSIAFIQDNRRIWAHGKEYACNNLTVVDNGEGSISFVDSLGNTLLALSADPNGYINVAGITEQAYTVFVSRGDFANYVEAVELLKRDFEEFKSRFNPNNFILKSDMLDNVVRNSNNPVKSSGIYSALQEKANAADVNNAIQNIDDTVASFGRQLQTIDELTSAANTRMNEIDNILPTKQNSLIPGAGISIKNNVISATTDGGLLLNTVVITKSRYDSLVENNLIDADTFYFTYEGEEPSGNSWHFGEPFPIILTDTWEFGGTFPITLS